MAGTAGPEHGPCHGAQHSPAQPSGLGVARIADPCFVSRRPARLRQYRRAKAKPSKRASAVKRPVSASSFSISSLPGLLTNCYLQQAILPRLVRVEGAVVPPSAFRLRVSGLGRALGFSRVGPRRSHCCRFCPWGRCLAVAFGLQSDPDVSDPCVSL